MAVDSAQSRGFLNYIRMETPLQRVRKYKKALREMLENPRYLIMYKGKEVRRYAFYRQALSYCLKHNRKLQNEKVYIVDLATGEETTPCDNTLW